MSSLHRVKYSKISEHLKLKHRNNPIDFLSCPTCKVLVSPSDVPFHMGACNAGKSCTPESHSGKQGTSAQSMFNFESSDSNEADEDLKTYLIKNFALSSYGIQNCEEMFCDYEEASRSGGELALLYLADFILAVNQLAKTCWNKQVGPQKMKQKIAELTKKNIKIFTLMVLRKSLSDIYCWIFEIILK